MTSGTSGKVVRLATGNGRELGKTLVVFVRKLALNCYIRQGIAKKKPLYSIRQGYKRNRTPQEPACH
jgi:hypothetical protein